MFILWWKCQDVFVLIFSLLKILFYFIDPDGNLLDITFDVNSIGEVKNFDDKKYYDKRRNEADNFYSFEDNYKEKGLKNTDSTEASGLLIGQLENKRARLWKSVEEYVIVHYENRVLKMKPIVKPYLKSILWIVQWNFY